LWSSVNVATASFKWFGGTTLAAQLTGEGAFTCRGDITTYRAAAPTVGALFFGNTVSKYIYYDASKFNFVGGNILSDGGVLSSSLTAGVGYSTGAGGTITQLTSKATPVTLNRLCGTITTAADALAAGAVVSFTFNNSSWHSDHMVLDTVGGTDGAYTVGFSSISDGVVRIWIKNTSTGSLSQAIPIIFTIIKSVNS
jgi:hypothetical protein